MKVDMKICTLSLLVYFDTVGMGWKTKLSLYLLIKHLNTKTYRRVEVQLHNFLIVEIDSDECTHSHPKFLIPRERAFVLIGNGVKPRDCLDATEKRKYSAFARTRTHYSCLGLRQHF
jgi:hypothetical protein